MKISAVCLFIVLSFLMVINSLTAQETNLMSPEAMKALEVRARDHRPFSLNNILDMQEMSKPMLTNERTAFYEKFAINGGLMTGAFFMNLVMPGSGNLLLGDFGGGLGLMIPTMAGVVAITVLLFTPYSFFAPVGLMVYFVTEPLGWILPFAYAASWNNDLKTGLRLADPERTNTIKPIMMDRERTSFNGSTDGNRSIEFQLASYRF